MQRILRLIRALLAAASAPGFAEDLASAGAVPSLTELEQRATTENTRQHARREFHRDVARRVEATTLVTGDDFLRAAKIASGPFETYRQARMRYELLLAAVAMENREAETPLPSSWDLLLRTLGRPQRLATPVATESDASQTPMPAAVRNVWQRPEEARQAASVASANAEVQTLVEADQAARKSGGRLSPADVKKMLADDAERNRRIREIVEAGELHTATDFANASLIMQHSGSFSGYQLAHELAVCSLILGDRRTGRWLVAATYDRMLISVGHDQRFGTQGARMAPGDKPQLGEVDERGICDAQRLALGCPRLADKRADFYTRGPLNDGPRP
jgi:hypothetical protein